MHLQGFKLLALGALAVDAFKDASPFFYYSTAGQIQRFDAIRNAPSLTAFVSDHLGGCLTDFYIIVSQPGVNAADFEGGRNAPGLSKAIQSVGTASPIKSSYTVNEVLGDLNHEALRRMLEDKCGAMRMTVDASTGAFPVIGDSRPRVISIDFPPPSGRSRSGKLVENDGFLSSLIELLPTASYTIIYTTQPYLSQPPRSTSESDSPSYEMDDAFQSTFQMELKRDLSLHGRAEKGERSNETLVDGPLFERYGFLSPGLFMGLLAGILLLSVLYVGLSGLSSLQVSYAAFDKEMGPTQQKKQQ